MPEGHSALDALRQHGAAILEEWVRLQRASVAARPDLISGELLHDQSRELLDAFTAALREGATDFKSPAWKPVRDVLDRVTAERARQGFSPSETAMFVLSLKEPLFTAIRERVRDTAGLASEIWTLTTAIDTLALHTTEVYQKQREEVITRQRTEMLELSTPVVTLWKGVLALPLIGTLDSERTQGVMENLLQRIVDTGSTIAILDITGVPTVDTLVAQHLLKTVAAARLMGADCIISGIRPQIAQTIVHLGIDLNTVTTKATLADAFAVALERLGLAVTARPGPASGAAGARPPAPVGP